MKTVKDWIEILEEFSKCGICGSEYVYLVITPYPHKYASEPYIRANAQRGIMITCNNCGAVGSLSAEDLEN
jgi:uncharacterized Zn finger protein